MKIFKPEIFQGKLSLKKYFEGWYFKCVDALGAEAVSIIPGISLSGDKTHAFIQFFDRSSGKADYFRFDKGDFSASKKSFEVIIGKNSFSLNGLELDIENAAKHIKAKLEFSGITHWPVSLLSPGVMGWYRFVPKMECYHGVLSFNHHIKGWIETDGVRRDFSGGRGYCEKDWGTSMPASWIWLQSNHFEETEASLFVSIAKIPWLGGWFPGFIAGFYHKGEIYRFATYTGAKLVRLEITPEKIYIVFKGSGMILEIEAIRAEGVGLPAPVFGEMKAIIKEALSSSVKIVLKTINGKIIYEGSGVNAGLEVVGNTAELIP